ncbi:TetR/AcrR family transcriptional regulator [Pseudodesulfovibrio sp. zrk46]|uniref:TetR/AcrR family transcriptional regulator n=1 Tax=Pseudodesulfovibrio sp. zrk46 TaxID=2725288 RepID=UPI001449DF62|nr:TetR/AcrR family transcriptional regulator [Pseudodesulfovibrio sp. zrk46]QJB56757.1 TetR/AcrR family transcriptional regulator [Pseudodesulfovibrio sp. zrk46]
MRKQDEDKKQALFDATIKLVNEVGFAASSVSKIAKEAGVSPSTLYVYHENKEDLIVSAYVSIKKELAERVMRNFDDSLPIRDIVRNFCFAVYEYISNNQDKGMFLDQFSNTPYTELVNHEELSRMYAPIWNAFQRGMEQKILKNVQPKLLSVFCFYPFAILANPRHCGADCVMDEQAVETVFNMTWDAIRY